MNTSGTRGVLRALRGLPDVHREVVRELRQPRVWGDGLSQSVNTRGDSQRKRTTRGGEAFLFWQTIPLHRKG